MRATTTRISWWPVRRTSARPAHRRAKPMDAEAAAGSTRGRFFFSGLKAAGALPVNRDVAAQTDQAGAIRRLGRERMHPLAGALGVPLEARRAAARRTARGAQQT